MITYLNKRNKIVVKINNLYFYKYLKKVVGFYKKLQHYYELYSLKVKKIVEQDWIHKIDENTLLAYFNSKHDLDISNEKKIFSNVFSHKPKLYSLCKKNFGS